MSDRRVLVRIAAPLAVATICSVLLLLPVPARAVVGGTDDTANLFENVGVLQLHIEEEWFDFCSGTLVADDVVLAAAHCTDFLQDEGEDGFGPDDLRISFDPAPDVNSTYYSVDHIVVHPDWFTAPTCLGNSKRLCLAPPAEDIALVWLSESVAGVVPAPVDDGIRSYREVSVITEHDVFPDRFVKITRGTCFGDSGGPLFHDGTVVGINTWTFSYRCDGPNFAYRVDAPTAQEFLDTHL